jgi:hypothetical protein
MNHAVMASDSSKNSDSILDSGMDYKQSSVDPGAVSIDASMSSGDLSHPDDNPGDEHDGSAAALKRKQKRNKPTLSCAECVERKTKVCKTFHYSLAWIIIIPFPHFRVLNLSLRLWPVTSLFTN